jgi:hypothetical protein
MARQRVKVALAAGAVVATLLLAYLCLSAYRPTAAFPGAPCPADSGGISHDFTWAIYISPADFVGVAARIQVRLR